MASANSASYDPEGELYSLYGTGYNISFDGSEKDAAGEVILNVIIKKGCSTGQPFLFKPE